MFRHLIIIVFLLLFSIVFISGELINNLESYWKMDDASGDLIDAHSTYNLTYNGALYGQTGVINDAIGFDGTNDWATVGHTTDLTFNRADSWSISLWINTSNTAQVFPILSKQESSTGYNGYIFHQQTSTFAFNIADSGSRNIYLTLPEASVADGNWHHIVFTYNGSSTVESLTLYLDNSDSGTPLGTTLLTTTAATASFDLAYRSTAAGWGYWEGDIDEIGVWRRELTSGEVSELYNSGSGLAYPFAVDTCSCAGAGNNWEINMADNCEITEACDLTTGTLSFTGAGYVNCDAQITTTNLGDPGALGILNILDDCLIYVKG